MTNQEINALRPSHIVAAMQEGQRYGQQEIATKVRKGIDVTRKVLAEMVQSGSIRISIDGRTKLYELPVDAAWVAPVLPGRYIPAWSEMGLRDIGVHQRMCEGARNNETGVV